MAPILNPGGFSSEALAYAVALHDAYEEVSTAGASVPRPAVGARQFAEQADPGFLAGVPAPVRGPLEALLRAGRERRRGWDVAVCHATPDVWLSDGAFGWGRVEPCPPPGAGVSVGRAMYETDRLPDSWVPRLNRMDEVWVPTQFAVDQFVRSGVDRSRIAVVPEAVDTGFFDPSRHSPRSLPSTVAGDNVFRLLSVFKWERRKGWDVLLRAYFSEFSADDAVALVIKTQAFHSGKGFEGKVQEFVRDELGESARRPLARYTILSDDIPLEDLPGLYKAADAFVIPSRGEGWGRPHVEAMSMGLPVIATNWSGPTAYMDASCALPLAYTGLSDAGDAAPPGHRWAEPSVPELRKLMRWVSMDRTAAADLGRRARARMLERFSPKVVVAEHILPRLRRLTGGSEGRAGRDEL